MANNMVTISIPLEDAVQMGDVVNVGDRAFYVTGIVISDNRQLLTLWPRDNRSDWDSHDEVHVSDALAAACTATEWPEVISVPWSSE